MDKDAVEASGDVVPFPAGPSDGGGRNAVEPDRLRGPLSVMARVSRRAFSEALEARASDRGAPAGPGRDRAAALVVLAAAAHAAELERLGRAFG